MAVLDCFGKHAYLLDLHTNTCWDVQLNILKEHVRRLFTHVRKLET